MTKLAPVAALLPLLALGGCADTVSAPDSGSVTTEQAVVTTADGDVVTITLTYDSEHVPMEVAQRLVTHVRVVNDGVAVTGDDVRLADSEETPLHGQLLPPAHAHWDVSDLHPFNVEVEIETIDTGDVIDNFRWEWIENIVFDLEGFCPPGHGG